MLSNLITCIPRYTCFALFKLNGVTEILEIRRNEREWDYK